MQVWIYRERKVSPHNLPFSAPNKICSHFEGKRSKPESQSLYSFHISQLPQFFLCENSGPAPKETVQAACGARYRLPLAGISKVLLSLRKHSVELRLVFEETGKGEKRSFKD